MTIWILRTQVEEQVSRDLKKICPDPKMSIDLIDTRTDRRHSGKVTYSTQTISTFPCNVVYSLANNQTHVCITGRGGEFIIEKPSLENLRGVALRQYQGATGWQGQPKLDPPPDWINIVYDPTDDRGNGYYVYDADDKKIASPSDTILFHELAHARLIALKLQPVDAPLAERERDAIMAENAYRQEIGLPLRSGARGGTGFKPLAPPPDQPVTGSPACFIATAALGSALAPDVEFLRRFRDDILRKTRSGREFFDEYWKHYYQISPSIVDLMDSDPQVRDLVRWSVVSPLVEYLRIMVEFPDASLDNVPQPWRSYLLQMRNNMEVWSEQLTPYAFDGLSPSEAAEEIRLVLRYVYRHEQARRRYLVRLRSLGCLPLKVPMDERARIETMFREDGRSEEEITLLVARDSQQTSCLSSDTRLLPVVTNYETFDPTLLTAETQVYSVRIRNATVETFDEVVLFYRRLGTTGVTFLGETGFPPGEVIVFPLGICPEMVSYVVGIFKGGSLVAKIPQFGEAMTPQLAATLDPDRPDACTDSWGVHAESVLPLDQYEYTVAIRNNTPDVWSSIVIFYMEKGQSEQGLETTAPTNPGEVVTFPLCPCDMLDGYAFSIFDDRGIRVLFDGSPTFPATGRMNARRAFEYKTSDLDACGDVWVIGG